MLGKRLGIMCLVLLLAALPACAGRSGLPFISLESGFNPEPAERETKRQEMLRLGIAGMGSPQFIASYYAPLMDYLQQRLDIKIQMVLKNSYTEINDLIASGNVHAAFISTYCYVLLGSDGGMELFVAPVNADDAPCSSYIITRKDSGTITFEGLRGKSFAFTDPLSTTGTLYPLYLLSAVGEKPETFFSSFIYTSGSDNSIRAVAGRLVDGAAVNSLVYDYLAEHSPDVLQHISVIHRSRPFSSNPLVVSRSIDPEVREQLRHVLLTMHENEQGRNILAGLSVRRFIPHLQVAYDEIRAMAEAVGKAP